MNFHWYSMDSSMDGLRFIQFETTRDFLANKRIHSHGQIYFLRRNCSFFKNSSNFDWFMLNKKVFIRQSNENTRLSFTCHTRVKHHIFLAGQIYFWNTWYSHLTVMSTNNEFVHIFLWSFQKLSFTLIFK